MRTAGIDLSSQDRKSAACVMDWSGYEAEIISLDVNVSDEVIARLIGEVDKLGIDIPLGWPIAFVEAVARHSHDATWPETYRHADIEAYRYRRTDVYVRGQVGLAPLSVSTDRIGIPAMRAAALLATVSPRVPLDGSGTVVEVYPAAALRRWGLSWRRYKGADHEEERRALVQAFAGRIGDRLSLSPTDRRRCEDSDDAFDALIAACVARASAVEAVDRIPDADRDAARREGWIALPQEASLSTLV
jgi:predicted nuclease with RNAse H fold